MPAQSDPVTIRPAERSDAADLARLVDLAGEGLPAYFWTMAAEPGETAVDVGIRRAERDEGAFSWRNAVVAEIGGGVAGALIDYRIADVPEPLDEQPPMFRPLQELENQALGTHYVNVLATYPRFRGRGVGSRLLAEAEAHGSGARGMSLIVADGNGTARRLYERAGYVERARARMVKEDWASESSEWVLMVKHPAA